MSPRAAARLVAMGFTRVYDYVGGKNEWLAAESPRGRVEAGQIRSEDLARRARPRADQMIRRQPLIGLSSNNGAFVWSLAKTTSFMVS